MRRFSELDDPSDPNKLKADLVASGSQILLQLAAHLPVRLGVQVTDVLQHRNQARPP